MSLGDRLRKLREQKGLTQKEFASRLKIPNQNVSNYERGFRQPDYETLQRFADYFEVTTDYLLGRSENQKITTNNSSDKSVIKINDTMEINLDDLTDYQQAILEYALSKDEVSFEKKPEDVLEMLARFEAFYLMEKELSKKTKETKGTKGTKDN